MFTILLYFHDLPRFVITCVKDLLEICLKFFSSSIQLLNKYLVYDHLWIFVWMCINLWTAIYKWCTKYSTAKYSYICTYVQYSDSVPQWTHTTLRINHLYLFPFKKICSICIVRELFTSDIDLMESESKVVFATREGRRSDEPGHGVFKTIFEPESSEKGLKVSC